MTRLLLAVSLVALVEAGVIVAMWVGERL